MTLAHRLAAYSSQLDYSQIPEKTRHEVRRRVIDSLACAAGAWNAGAVRVARTVAGRVTGTPGASYLGGANVTSPDLAAFVNGILFRYLDYNDTYLSKEPAHPSDNRAAVLAAGEMADRKGRDLFVAEVLAYEIQCRLCDASSLRKNGFDHVTYGALSSCAGG